MSKATKAARRRKPTPPASPNNVLRVPKKDGEGENLATARVIMDPDFRHGMAVAQVLKAQFGNQDSSPGIGDYADALKEKANAAAEGDLAFASRMLAAQAITLDSIFGEMARRMALNMGEYLGATETYGRIAMKAQAQSRATLEALAKLHQPREQTGRHVHVNEGGQAIIADQFHNHAGGGGQKNGLSSEKSHATGAAGVGPALPSPDPFTDGVPIPSREGAETMQNARGDESRSA
ncbi:MAG: hypothetical protein K2W86_01745 [Sphingomonas sp.]|nr:hypothetical protein [Sphingomonas sp.]